jgi:hypothetical protein
MYNRFIIALLFFFCTMEISLAQKVSRLEIKQIGENVRAFFSIEGKGTVSRIDLIYSLDGGKNWSSPVKQLTGDRFNLMVPGNYFIDWDVPSEKVKIEGALQVQLITYYDQSSTNLVRPYTYDMNRVSYWKKTWFVSSVVFAGTGIFTSVRANVLYKEYLRTGSQQTRSTIETLDKVTPLAYGISGLSAVGWIIQKSKQNKLKKQLGVTIFPMQQGGGMMLTYNF